MMKIEISIPESINDITLEQYQKFNAIYDKDADAEFINRKTLEIFYGIDGKHYNNLKFADVELIVNRLNNALAEKIKLINRFTLNGVEYGFVPDLDDITMGEFVDLDTNSTSIDNMHKLMSIIYRPIKESNGDKYSITSYTGTNEKLKEMPLGIALSAMDFFFTIGLQLTNATLKSLIPKGKVQKQKHDLAKSGIGTLLSSPYRMGISEMLIK